MKTGIKVADIMIRNPLAVAPFLGVRECAKTMLKHRVGSLIIKKNSKLLGILTEKDFVEKIVAKGNNPDKYKAKDIMSTRVKTIRPNADVYDAMLRMRKSKVRRLPVVESGKIVGMLTDKNIIRIEPQLFDFLAEKFRVMGFMQKKPFKYLEGTCETCGNYVQLYNTSGKLLCEGCRDIAR